MFCCTAPRAVDFLLDRVSHCVSARAFTLFYHSCGGGFFLNYRAGMFSLRVAPDGDATANRFPGWRTECHRPQTLIVWQERTAILIENRRGLKLPYSYRRKWPSRRLFVFTPFRKKSLFQPSATDEYRSERGAFGTTHPPLTQKKTALPVSQRQVRPPDCTGETPLRAYLRTVFRSPSSPPDSTGPTGNPAGGSGSPGNKHVPTRPPSAAGSTHSSKDCARSAPA